MKTLYGNTFAIIDYYNYNNSNKMNSIHLQCTSLKLYLHIKMMQHFEIFLGISNVCLKIIT